MSDQSPQQQFPPAVEIVDRPPAAGDEGEEREAVTQPQKLIRIASMVRNMLEEVRRAPLDDAGRRMLRQIHDKSMHELEDVLSPDLREELSDVVLTFGEAAPSESELRIAQAQLVGWLEGLFHGIQASMFSQQMAAQAQMEQMRRRALGMGGGPDGSPAPGNMPGDRRQTGYL
ncbi:MAG: proteasome activator [Acidimicrobiia bacterium]